MHDQWQAQIQAQLQLKADVYVRSDNLSDEQIRVALLEPCARVENTRRRFADAVWLRRPNLRIAGRAADYPVRGG